MLWQVAHVIIGIICMGVFWWRLVSGKDWTSWHMLIHVDGDGDGFTVVMLMMFSGDGVSGSKASLVAVMELCSLSIALTM